MARPYAKLRGLLREHEIRQEDLAVDLDLSPGSVSNRMNCKESWKVHEMWLIMNMLGLPAHKLHEIFPQNGQNETGVVRPTKARRTA